MKNPTYIIVDGGASEVSAELLEKLKVAFGDDILILSLEEAKERNLPIPNFSVDNNPPSIPINSKERHKWDPFTDKCEKCGIEKRTRQVYTKDLMIRKTVKEFLVDGKWVMESQICKPKSPTNLLS